MIVFAEEKNHDRKKNQRWTTVPLFGLALKLWLKDLVGRWREWKAF
jgi:hypothetical protein